MISKVGYGLAGFLLLAASGCPSYAQVIPSDAKSPGIKSLEDVPLPAPPKVSPWPEAADPQAKATVERCGEVAAVWREREEFSDILEVVRNSPNEVSGLAVEEVDRARAVTALRPSPGCDRRPIRADRHSVHVAHLLGPDRYPDRAQQLSICDRPDPHCAIVGAGHCEAPTGVDG